MDISVECTLTLREYRQAVWKEEPSAYKKVAPMMTVYASVIATLMFTAHHTWVGIAVLSVGGVFLLPFLRLLWMLAPPSVRRATRPGLQPARFSAQGDLVTSQAVHRRLDCRPEDVRLAGDTTDTWFLHLGSHAIVPLPKRCLTLEQRTEFEAFLGTLPLRSARGT